GSPRTAIATAASSPATAADHSRIPPTSPAAEGRRHEGAARAQAARAEPRAGGTRRAARRRSRALRAQCGAEHDRACRRARAGGEIYFGVGGTTTPLIGCTLAPAGYA